VLNADLNKQKHQIRINRDVLTNMVRAQKLALQLKVTPRQEMREYVDPLQLLPKRKSVLSSVLKSPSSSGSSSQSNKRSVSFKDEDDIIPTFSEHQPYKEMSATRKRYFLQSTRKDQMVRKNPIRKIVPSQKTNVDL
jgi:hypothetical protein